jgi:hypothetical protein
MNPFLSHQSVRDLEITDNDDKFPPEVVSKGAFNKYFMFKNTNPKPFWHWGKTAEENWTLSEKEKEEWTKFILWTTKSYCFFL